MSAQLVVPEQDLKRLSFAPTHPRKFEAWMKSIPMVNLGEASRMLYQAIQELNRVKVDPQSRFQMLETLRAPIHVTCEALSKHFLNQSIILPAKAAKVANLAQALQNHLAIGYKIVALQGFEKSNSSDMQKLAAKSVHRALMEMSDVLLRSHQLYYPAPARLWWNLNQTFLFAEEHELAQLQVEDPERPSSAHTTVSQAYFRSVLLTASQPNQLRQNEMIKVDEVAWALSYLVTATSEYHSDEGTFLVSLNEDSKPLHASLSSSKAALESSVRLVDCQAVSQRIGSALRESEEMLAEVLGVNAPLSVELTRHLARAWGRLSQRSFSRAERLGKIELAVGMSAVHYFLSNGQEFENLLHGGDAVAAFEAGQENPFLVAETDMTPSVWDDAIDARDPEAHASEERLQGIRMESDKLMGEKPSDEPPQSSANVAKYKSFHCDVVNGSPGGYCLALTGSVLELVKTGELLGVRESVHGAWNIAVIRWVKQSKAQGVRIGLQLLAPNARAVAVKLVHKTGSEQNFLRAFLLPELKAIGQPATLVTLKLAYKVGSKIFIRENAEELPARLSKKNESTSGFMQFQFSYIGKQQKAGSAVEIATPQHSIRPTDNFDSIWSDL